MSNTAESYRGRMVCEIVSEPEDVGRVINLFHLAGAMTDQVVEPRITRDPGRAGSAVLSEALTSFSPDALKAISTLRNGMRLRDKNMTKDGMDELCRTMYEDPYHKAGVALDSTVRGATAIIVNVDNPAAFRAELDIFKGLACPLEQ